LTGDPIPAERRTSSRARLRGLDAQACDARQGIDRTKEAGPWSKWKIDPISVDAVLA
jgi:DNA ligase-1